MADREHLEILWQGVEAWNQWRLHGPSRVDLKDASLSGVDLAEADLRGVDLRHAKLDGADLSGADLGFFERIAGNSSPAEVMLAVFGPEVADLRCADLHGANCQGTKFFWTRLDDADLGRAKMGSKGGLWKARENARPLIRWTPTVLSGVDLSKVRGLERVSHRGRCSIDVDTLRKSQGRIPNRFLRGCGVPEFMIEYQRSLFGTGAIEFYSCFISYSHQDKAFARRLHEGLQGRGIRCWLDEKDLDVGDSLSMDILGAIGVHDKVLLACSESSLQSAWVEREIRATLGRETQKGRLLLIPLNLDGYLFEGWESGLALDVRDRLAADFTGWERNNARFEEQFERVVKALRTDERERELVAKP